MSSESPKTILVTGGSGFVAGHVLRSLLVRGYNVRTTVRSDSSAEKIKRDHPQWVGQLSFAQVPNIEVSGAFDEAVKGVDGIIHTASPFVMAGIKDNVTELLNPAINGTKRIFESAKLANSSSPASSKITRVVLTSSFASIVDMSHGLRPGHVYSGADWNPETWEVASTTPHGGVAYCASKAFAERAAWDFMSANGEKSGLGFDLATICPPMVYGPAAAPLQGRLDALNTSSADIYRLTNGSLGEVPDTSFFAWVDGRDVGEAHVRALEVPEAAGQRYLVTPGNFTYQEICDIIREDFPERRDRTPEGTVGKARPETYGVDGSKAEKELGIKYTGLRQSIVDMVRQFGEKEAEAGR